MANTHSLVLSFLLIGFVTAKTFFVTPNLNTSCPEEPCLTISEYATQPRGYFTPRATMIFLPGEHTLTRNFFLQDMDELSLRCYPGDGFVATVSCLQESNLKISDIINVTVTGVNFADCYGDTVTGVDKFVLEFSTVQSVLKNIANETPLYFSDVREIYILNCSFVWNEVEESCTGYGMRSSQTRQQQNEYSGLQIWEQLC